ncbi:MAG: hypothetical protein WC426_00900 [Sulfuriferula sp.]
MITENAIAAIGWLFEKSARENLSSLSQHDCKVMPLLDTPKQYVDEKHSLVALNIASYSFRIVVLLDYYPTAAALGYLADVLRIADKKLAGQALFDAQGEFINMLCGVVNRRLSTEFRHVGMSTPFFLSSACGSYVAILKPTHAQSFEVSIDNTPLFKLTLCTCVASGTTLDFHVARTEQEEVSTGELEFF